MPRTKSYLQSVKSYRRSDSGTIAYCRSAAMVMTSSPSEEELDTLHLCPLSLSPEHLTAGSCRVFPRIDFEAIGSQKLFIPH